MDKKDYPSNNIENTKPSKTKKAPKKEEPDKGVKKVVESEVVVRKKSTRSKVFETLSSVFSYVAEDVLIPAAKDMLSDAVTQGVDRMLFGESRSRNKPHSGHRNGYVSYNRFSAQPRKEETRNISRRARSMHDFDEIVLSSRLEAENVIDRLYEIVSQFDSATVADLYELVGIDSKYPDEDWGWTELRGATVRRVRSGYLLDLPKPVQLD